MHYSVFADALHAYEDDINALLPGHRVQLVEMGILTRITYPDGRTEEMLAADAKPFLAGYLDGIKALKLHQSRPAVQALQQSAA